MEKIKKILKSMNVCGDGDAVEITPFQNAEDGEKVILDYYEVRK